MTGSGSRPPPLALLRDVAQEALNSWRHARSTRLEQGHASLLAPRRLDRLVAPASPASRQAPDQPNRRALHFDALKTHFATKEPFKRSLRQKTLGRNEDALTEHPDGVTGLRPAVVQDALHQARDSLRRWRSGFILTSPLQQLVKRGPIDAVLRREDTTFGVDFRSKVAGFDDYDMYAEWARLEFEGFRSPPRARICSRCKGP